MKTIKADNRTIISAHYREEQCMLQRIVDRFEKVTNFILVPKTVKKLFVVVALINIFFANTLRYEQQKKIMTL